MTAEQWVLRLVGDFEFRGETHLLPCKNEQNARQRAVWWAGYRPELRVDVEMWDAGVMLRARGPHAAPRRRRRPGVRS